MPTPGKKADSIHGDPQADAQELKAHADLPTAEPQTDGGAPPAELQPAEPAPAAAPAPERPVPPNPFDPKSLRLDSDYAKGLGVRKVVTVIPNRKPHKSEWFRVRAGAEWRLETAVLELEKGVERATYLVAAHLWPELGDEIVPALLVCCTNRTGDLFLWRIKLPGVDGRVNTWTESAVQAMKLAETDWCRMFADMDNGFYQLRTSSAGWPEPTWPELTFPEILKIAFRDRMIDTVDHPILTELRGGV